MEPSEVQPISMLIMLKQLVCLRFLYCCCLWLFICCETKLKKKCFFFKYLCFYKIYTFCRKICFYMKKSFYNETIFLLKKTFFTEKKYLISEIYFYTENICVINKIWIFLKYIFISAKKKILIIKIAFVKTLLWTQ